MRKYIQVLGCLVFVLLIMGCVSKTVTPPVKYSSDTCQACIERAEQIEINCHMYYRHAGDAMVGAEEAAKRAEAAADKCEGIFNKHIKK